MVCLQRLVIAKGLPKTRLKETINALSACADLGLDVQLKILQALPSLLQNYSDDLNDELLAGALQLCALLQSAKAQTVSGVAAATLQQLVSAVFEKVVDEDRKATEIAARHEVPGDGKAIFLRPAAFDAYRMFRDLVLAAEERPTKFVRLTSLSPETSLELIWSALTANARLFISHPELSGVIRANLLPAVTRPLSEKLPFPLTVRSLRLMDLLLNRYFNRFLGEFEVALGLLTHNLDPDSSAPWKRILAMEVLRNFFASGSCIVDAYAAYDQAEGGKSIIQDVLSAFVRLSAEKPAVIGLGQQSSVPTGPAPQREPGSEQTAFEAAGSMAGVISSALGVAEASVPGISSQWSLPRAACLDQLDKAEAPALPETYVYAMVLDSLNSMSDTLARVVVPLASQQEKAEPIDDSDDVQTNGHSVRKQPDRMSRSQSFRQRAVPANPLQVADESAGARVRAVAGLIDSCWPAVLATCSTYLNAALEEQYYRNLIKCYQRFAQVAGLLRLSTARDALITTLSKSAVPPHIVNAALTDSMRSPTTPSTEGTRIFSNPRNLLSVDSLVSQASSASADRRLSMEPVRPMLSTRNLQSLRALLNLGIALGPTLDTAFAVIVDALRQADLILSSSVSQQMMRQGAQLKMTESPAAVQAFTAEVNAVEGAASRLLEATSDYPNDAFITVLTAFTRLLGTKRLGTPSSPRSPDVTPPQTPPMKGRSFSGLPGISTFAEMQARDYQFVIPKLGTLSRLNIARFVAYNPGDSGWTVMVNELIEVSCSASKPRDARRAATDVLCSTAAEAVSEASQETEGVRRDVQRRALAVLLGIVDRIYSEDDELTGADLEIQGRVLEALRSILERCGDSLVAGWMKTLAIISSAFERTESATTNDERNEGTRIDWDHISNDLVSVQIGRSAFTALQLICSDFLTALPVPVMPSLLAALHRFVMQTDDLNMALTTISMVMTVAEHLANAGAAKSMHDFCEDADDVHEMIRNAEVLAWSRPAQLLLLLLHLRVAVREAQKEVRNAAFQTMCSILRASGDQLSPRAWDYLLRWIVLKTLADDAQSYFTEAENPQETEHRQARSDEAMSRTVILGAAGLVAQQIRILERHDKLPSLWEVFLNKLEAYSDCQSHALNQAVYTALAQVLSHITDVSSIWTTPIYRALAFFLKRLPEDSGKADNDGAFLAYVDTGIELYRLAKQSMGSSQVRKLIDNVYHCVEFSTGPSHGADASNLSPLQSKALQLLKSIRTDQATLPSTLIQAAAHLVVLHHDSVGKPAAKQGPTFIALASEAIDWLTSLLRLHGDEETIASDAVPVGVQTLQRLMKSKYEVSAKCKGTALWRKATAALVDVAESLLQTLERQHIDSTARASLWADFAGATAAIVDASGLDAVTDGDEIWDDEASDIESFRALESVLIPGLGDPSLPDSTRLKYCRSLFEASIVHRTEPGEIPLIEKSPLKDIHRIRRGRARRVPFSRRERMSYVCFEELIALASMPIGTAENLKLAQAAGPLLVLRLAIPIRGYIADRPLKGKSPQPLSELEELIFCFDQIRKLQLHPEALSVDDESRGRIGSTAHLHFLYSLLAKAAAVAGDSWSGTQEVHEPLQRCLQGIVPFP